jgi:hypothetical protein
VARGVPVAQTHRPTALDRVQSARRRSPPLPVRAIGKALTTLVACAPGRGRWCRDRGPRPAAIRDGRPRRPALPVLRRVGPHALVPAVRRAVEETAHRNRRGSAVARTRVSRRARHGPGHLGGDDRAREGEGFGRAVRPRRILVGDAERLPFTDGSLELVAQISVPVSSTRWRACSPPGLRGRRQQPRAEDAVPHPGAHPARGLPPARDRDRRDRGGGPRHVLPGQALGLVTPFGRTRARRAW